MDEITAQHVHNKHQVVEVEVVEANMQEAVHQVAAGTQLRQQQHSLFAKAPVVIRRPVIRPATARPSDVHQHLRHSLLLVEVLVQQALEPAFRYGAAAVKATLVSHPGKRRGVHRRRPTIRREVHGRLAYAKGHIIDRGPPASAETIDLTLHSNEQEQRRELVDGRRMPPWQEWNSMLLILLHQSLLLV